MRRHYRDVAGAVANLDACRDRGAEAPCCACGPLRGVGVVHPRRDRAPATCENEEKGEDGAEDGRCHVGFLAPPVRAGAHDGEGEVANSGEYADDDCCVFEFTA